MSDARAWLPSWDTVDRGMDAVLAAIPADLRVLVHKNASFNVNRAAPYTIAVSMGDWHRRVVFEDASLSVAELKRRHAVGNAARSADVVLSGHRMLALDTSVFDVRENATFHAGGLVQLTYRLFDLSREPSIEVPLATFCEALTDDEVIVALAAEQELANALADARATKSASARALSLPPRPRGGNAAINVSPMAVERIVVNSKANRRSLLYYNESALLRAAERDGLPIPLNRLHAFGNRINGSTSRALQLGQSSSRLLTMDTAPNSDTALHPSRKQPSGDATGLAGRVGGMGLTSAYVCTRETIAAAITGVRSNQFMEFVQWQWLLGLVAFGFAFVCVAEFLVRMLLLAVASTLLLYPMLWVAWRTKNMRGKAHFTHLWRLAALIACPLAWWFSFGGVIVNAAIDATAGTGFAPMLSSLGVFEAWWLQGVVHFMLLLIIVAYVYDDAEVAAPPATSAAPATAAAAPATAAPAAAHPQSATLATSADLTAAPARGRGRKSSEHSHVRRRGRERSASTSCSSSASSGSSAPSQRHHTSGLRRRRRDETAAGSPGGVRAPGLWPTGATPSEIATVLALQQQILATQASIQRTLAHAYAQGRVPANSAVVLPPTAGLSAAPSVASPPAAMVAHAHVAPAPQR